MNRELLERVCHTPGIPGYEDDIEATVWLLKVFLEHAHELLPPAMARSVHPGSG